MRKKISKNKKSSSERQRARFSLVPNALRLTPNSGFTLIEVLIVVAITSLLAGIVLTYSSKGRTQVALYVEAAKISQVILRAKSLAIATYNNPDLPCGYGVNIDYGAKKYSLFSYKPADCRVSSISGGTLDPNMMTAISDYELPSGINYAPANLPLNYVLFVPPDPTTLLWNRDDPVPSNGAGGPSNINLASAGDSQSSITVRVTSAGQIAF